MTSVPSAILFPKLITLYKSLLSDSTHFIYKLYSLPIKTLLNIIPTLDMWMDTNAQSSLHTLPSEYSFSPSSNDLDTLCLWVSIC